MTYTEGHKKSIDLRNVEVLKFIQHLETLFMALSGQEFPIYIYLILSLFIFIYLENIFICAFREASSFKLFQLI